MHKKKNPSNVAGRRLNQSPFQVIEGLSVKYEGIKSKWILDALYQTNKSRQINAPYNQTIYQNNRS